ncbi:MAG: hypothetical protein JHC95_03840 [Solirubrobacteraceae bacterium]|nr:hypothetical protein [Solirubrobacteraceae bacterium]
MAIVNALAAVVGAYQWWRVAPSPLFWALARAGQALAIGQALLAGGLWIGGFEPGNDLYWLYAVLPVAVGFVAEGIRIASAHEVLEKRGLEDAAAVGELAEADQKSVVISIMRRELGVAALAAGVVAFLALRAVIEV